MNRDCALPVRQDVVRNLADARALRDLRKQKWTASSHPPRVARHDVQIGAHERSQVGLVDDEQVRLCDSGPPFARNLVAARDVDDVDREIRQLAAELSRQIVSPALDEQQLRMTGRRRIKSRLRAKDRRAPRCGAVAAPCPRART